MVSEVRAMENIAAARAALAERVVATWVGGAFLLGCALAIPYAGVRLGAVPGFLPAVLGTAVLAQLLTAVLFHLQYRIVRDSQLALLALAYASLAALNAVYMLTSPGVFSAGGLLGAGPQTSAAIKLGSQLLFGLLVVAFALADRFVRRHSRRWVGWVTVAVAAGSIALMLVALRLPLPALVTGTSLGPLVSDVLAPIQLGLLALGVVLLATSGLGTVTQVWMLAVTLGFGVEVLLGNTALSGARFTVGWYVARGAALASSLVILAVFLVKINDLLLRLAVRNRALAERNELAELELAAGEMRYRSLANVVPQLIWMTGSDGRVDYVNDRWVAFTGLDASQTRERGWHAAVVGGALDAAWDESLRTGLPYSVEQRLRNGASGRTRWFLIDAVPLRDAGGTVTRWIGSCTDIDRSKQIEEREAFLARAGDRLSASLDINATLAAIADLVTGRMAGWMRVDLLDEEGHFVPATIASERREEEIALRQLLGRPAGPALERLFQRAVADREPVVRRDLPPVADGIAGVRVGSAIVVPLVSGETTLGVLTLVLPSGESPDPEECAVARDFGRRASHALDHARMYERERAVADGLQRAMLPQTLPQLETVSFSASYSAASESQRVGGDFYDAFLLSDGRVALTIGDVTGHGLEAAVTMGEIRQALRATALEHAEPSTVLDRASRLLVASGRSLFVTAVFGILDTRTGLFRYATAGHPSPLLYDGERLTRLTGTGLPIGLRDEEGLDLALTLPEHCTLVLFTDGLLEFARNLDDGERRIEGAIRELGDTDVEHLAGALMKRVLGDDQATDDIAILTATIHEMPSRPPGETREWHFRSSDARTGAFVRHEIGALGEQWSGRVERGFEIELAFGELFSNVVRHAPGAVDVRLRSNEGTEITVTDEGAGFESNVPVPPVWAESGRGLALLHAVADRVAVERLPEGGTRVRVSFAAAGSP